MARTPNDYSDIINKTWDPGEEFFLKHPRMDLGQRAKIFAPFAALRGFGEKIQDENRKTTLSSLRELSEEEISILSDKLLQVKKGMEVTVTFFSMDPGGDGLGYYFETSGTVEQIDPLSRFLRIKENTADGVETVTVPFRDLYDISGDGIVCIDDFLGLDLPGGAYDD